MAKPGEVLGLDAVVAGMPHESTAHAIPPSHFSFVSWQDFLRFLKENDDAQMRAADMPEVAKSLLASVAGRRNSQHSTSLEGDSK